MNTPTQNLYPAQPGPVIGAEPIMPPTAQPMGYGQPIQPLAQPVYIPPGGQPPMQAPIQNQPIIVNQIPVIPIKFTTAPMAITCPFCRNNITTIVTTNFNWLNCLFCCFFCEIWLIVQLVQGKDLNCTDATHRCPQCNQIVGQYSAC